MRSRGLSLWRPNSHNNSNETSSEQNQHTHIKENEKELVLRESQCIFWLLKDAMKYF